MSSITVFAIVAVLLAVTVQVNAQSTAADEHGVRGVLTDFSTTLNQYDFKAWSRLFADDADFVVITGKHLKGRDEIETYHAAVWAGVYKDSRAAFTSLTIRFLRPDVAVAHGDAEITYNSGQNKRTGLVTMVLTKQGDRWLIAVVQNTLTGGSPVTPIGGLK